MLPCFCGCSGALGYSKPLVWCAATMQPHVYSTMIPEDRRSVFYTFWDKYSKEERAIRYRALFTAMSIYEFQEISSRIFKSAEQLRLTNKDRISRTTGMSYVLSPPSFRSASTFEIQLVHGIIAGGGLSISIGLNGDEVKLNRNLFGIKIS